MKFLLRLVRPLATLALASSALAQTAPAPADAGSTQPSPSRTAAPVPTAPTTPTPRTAADTFSSFEGASPAVRTAVANAQAVAQAIRAGSMATSSPSFAASPDLARAVSQASAAIVQEGRVARSDILAERQASLTRLRLAQTEVERQRLIGELRIQNGQRMEQQRETARQVRDRLRELRATTTLTPRPGN